MIQDSNFDAVYLPETQCHHFGKNLTALTGCVKCNFEKDVDGYDCHVSDF